MSKLLSSESGGISGRDLPAFSWLQQLEIDEAI